MDIIVDGYNVIFKVSELGYRTEKCDIETLRNRFLTMLEQFKEKRKHRLIVVFDGQGSGNSSGTRVSGIDVIFSRQDMDADEEIKKMVSDSNNPKNIVVITSDRDIELYVKRYGCKVVGPLAFYRDIKKKTSDIQTAGSEDSRLKAGGDDEPISKYIGPSRAEARYWLEIFSEKKEKGSDD